MSIDDDFIFSINSSVISNYSSSLVYDFATLDLMVFFSFLSQHYYKTAPIYL